MPLVAGERQFDVGVSGEKIRQGRDDDGARNERRDIDTNASLRVRRTLRQ